MADRISNHAIYFRLASDCIGAIQPLEIVQADLAGRGRMGDRSVSQRAAFSQSQQARRKPNFSHRHRDNIVRILRQA